MLDSAWLTSRAGDELRTRNIQLGRLVLCQLSYTRTHCVVALTFYSFPPKWQGSSATGRDVALKYEGCPAGGCRDRKILSSNKLADSRAMGFPRVFSASRVEVQPVLGRRDIIAFVCAHEMDYPCAGRIAAEEVPRCAGH